MKNMSIFKDRLKAEGNNSLMVILVLYDASIEFLEKAVGFAERNNRENKEFFTKKANDIIVELDKVLDMRSGGEVARNLKLLYSFMNRQLLDATASNTVKGLVDVKVMMNELRESWRTIDASSRAAVA